MKKFRSTHLMIGGKIACGRSIYRTPVSAGFTEFNNASNACEKCKASKHYAFAAKNSEQVKHQQSEVKDEIFSIDEWEPEENDNWLNNDLKIIKAHQQKQRQLNK